MNLNFTLIIEVVSFLLLLFLLKKLFYKPLLNILDRRAKGIEDAIEDAKKNQEEATNLLSQAQRKIDQSKQEALDLLEKARQQADEQRRKILQDAKAHSQRYREQAREDIERQGSSAREKLKKEVLDISRKLAEKILQREIKEKDQHRLIKEGLEEIGDGG